MKKIISNPWNASERDFPATGTREEQLRFLLNYAVLAPSKHNTQPWLFKVYRDTIELYADRSRVLSVVDASGREMIMSCGAALANSHFSSGGVIGRRPSRPRRGDRALLGSG